MAHFESRLMASAEENMNWPIMSHKLCHHGAWFLREKKDLTSRYGFGFGCSSQLESVIKTRILDLILNDGCKGDAS